MKKNLLYFFAAILALTTSCQDPEYVSPTADRQGITSITAIFTSGPYVDKEAVKYTIDASTVQQDTYVIPVPFYFPEDSENETTEYMSNMRVKVEIANNCLIDPAISILDLTKDNYFTFTEPNGEKRQICIRGERTKSSACELKTFDVVEPALSAVIDQDAATISITSTEDLSSVSVEASLSAHATITPNTETTKVDLSDGAEFTVTAHNGVDKKVYTVKRVVTPKIDYGFRSGSEVQLFNLDIETLGFSWTSANSPSLASSGNYLIVCMGDGSTPVYLNRVTGSKVGNITMGGADASGCVTSDLKGNILICNKADGGATFNIYRSSSVTSTPTSFISYSNASGLPIGGKVSVQGDIDGDAQIIATCDGIDGVSGSSNFVRWTVRSGVVGAPEVVTVNGVGYWGAPVSNTKVVSIGTSANDPYFLSYYDANVCYWVDGATNNAVTSISDGSGSSWGMNDNCLDAKPFNNAKYMTLFCVSHFPHWGMAPVLYMYEVSKSGDFNGDISDAPALVFGTGIDSKNTDVEGVAATGDVLLVPSTDGYMLYLYYFDNNCKTIGAYQFDCIDK